MQIDRRSLLMTAMATAAAAGLPDFAVAREAAAAFPKGFLWGASTCGYQAEGNSVNADIWALEHVSPTAFREPSGDAMNSLFLWEADLDAAKSLGLSAYRFSIEWSRIEPEAGQFSVAMLDHYKRIIEGCVARGMAPIATYSHFAAPRWFAVSGSWLSDTAPDRFARFCERATRHLGADIRYALTLNEPNLTRLLASAILPEEIIRLQTRMLDAAAAKFGAKTFLTSNIVSPEQVEPLQQALVKAHRSARQAIKSVRPELPVGLSLAMIDEQAAGEDTGMRDKVRRERYADWLDVAKEDDFLGVQNYERAIWGPKGRVPPPEDAPRNYSGAEVHAPSLAGAVRYAYEQTRTPIMVTEHGVGTDDDALRQRFLVDSLDLLKKQMNEGTPVLGYCHWSLIDNFEWIFGYGPKYGLFSVDRETFERSPKGSAHVYRDYIAMHQN